MRKRKLKPWVKTSIAFIVGVFVVAKITAAIDTYAVGSGVELKTVYGIVSMISDGQAHVRTIDGAYDLDIVLPLQKDYVPMVMVTIVLEGNSVIRHGLTDEKEEAAVMKKEMDMVVAIRDGVFRSTYE